MKLSELLCIINQSTNISIIDYDTKSLLSKYDGKSSIDVKFNDIEVFKMYAQKNEIFIEILYWQVKNSMLI